MFGTNTRSVSKITLGISACLLGEKVRYDGGHKHDRFLTHTLGKYVNYIPVCPEVECGFPIPREPLHLAGSPKSPRLITVRTHRDHTDQMLRWARHKTAALKEEGLCGFIFKANSPSCGMERVEVWNEKGKSAKKGVGIFARVFVAHFPLMPVEDENRLHDSALRENFIERIFTLKRWRETQKPKQTRAKLVTFHAQHEILLRSHSPKHLKAMETLVTHAEDMPLGKLYNQYQEILLQALRHKATRRKHYTALRYILRCLRKQLAAGEEKELLEVIENYRKGSVSLVVAITFINHYVRKYDDVYLKKQYYLSPDPLEFQLRNHFAEEA